LPVLACSVVVVFDASIFKRFGRRTRLKHAQGMCSTEAPWHRSPSADGHHRIISGQLLPSWAGQKRVDQARSHRLDAGKKKASRFELIVKVADPLFIATLYLCLPVSNGIRAQAAAI